MILYCYEVTSRTYVISSSFVEMVILFFGVVEMARFTETSSLIEKVRTHLVHSHALEARHRAHTSKG